MKAIMMSIRPEWVKKILNKEKTIEIRKRFPVDYVGWVYIYCTKDKKYANLINRGGFLTGMVVARFWCDKVEGINRYCTGRGISYKTETLNDIELCDKSCLDLIEIDHYLYFKKGYAIHITKLEIFDKPKEISEFAKQEFDSFISGQVEHYKYLLTRAPQSWCYVEV